MQQLIKEYKESLKQIEVAKCNAVIEDDKILLGNMASDLKYALEWMRSGRRPGHRRGIERRAAYQNEQPLDPLVMQSFVAESTTSHTGITEFEKERIKEALSNLTSREREIYVLVRGHCFSRQEAAKMLGVKKGTINKILSRCDEKIKVKKSTSLFCEPLAN
ncbi:sigma-70 family RNA polymerase sigma factor [Bacillus solitudinis]|uniref:sigma-70 family RNA polymerase sigma factor n=1 Tax=Bacillus solitudinis TaxID=2014074 RepID=UPI000C23F8E1|nr:sigma-70 family RNA polymerase sigma factor [Bacillus solitudinis]